MNAEIKSAFTKSTVAVEGANGASAIEAGSQVNILEAISIGGTDAPISDKKVDIPVATAEKLGVVKSSSEKDQIAVGEDGIMSINTVSLSKIVQAADETLIINGGNSGLTIGE